MDSLQFCYWLQGFFEINGFVESLSTEQIKMIQSHLDLVFRKNTYGYTTDTGCYGTCGINPVLIK